MEPYRHVGYHWIKLLAYKFIIINNKSNIKQILNYKRQHVNNNEKWIHYELQRSHI